MMLTTHREVPPPAIDLGLALFDFADAYRRDPDVAVVTLQALLLDEAACQSRIALLRALGAGPPPDDFAAELRLVAAGRLAEGLRDGRLDPGRIDALTRAPDVLWRAHEALCADEAPPEEAPGEFTTLAASGRWNDLAARLRGYLPAVLEFVGLPETVTLRLLAFVVDRARDVALTGKRFRELLPVWLEEFAREGQLTLARGITPGDWMAILERGALRLVLGQDPPAEPAWQLAFRQAARRARNWQEVEALPPPAGAPPAAFPVFRRELHGRVQQERERALDLFELRQSA